MDPLTGNTPVVEVPAHRATHDLLRSALPFRTFRWHYGQRHYSGSYWSATMSAHVIYESRLELSRLLMADFDQSVKFIVAQPFLIRSRVQGVVRHHIPDYLLLTDANPVLVDVKRANMPTTPTGTSASGCPSRSTGSQIPSGLPLATTWCTSVKSSSKTGNGGSPVVARNSFGDQVTGSPTMPCFSRWCCA